MSRQRPHQRHQRSTRDTHDVDAEDRPAHVHASALPEALQAFRIDAPVDEHLPSMRYDLETSGEPRVVGGASSVSRRATAVPQPPLGHPARLSSTSPTSETFSTSVSQPQATSRSQGPSRGDFRSQTPPTAQHMPTTHIQSQAAFHHSRSQPQQPTHHRATVPPGRPHSALDNAYLSDLSTVSGASSARGNAPPSHASQSVDSAHSHSASSESPGMPGGSWERGSRGREILGSGAGSSRRQATFLQEETYDLPTRGGTGRKAHFPVSTLRGGSAMNRAQSYAYGSGEGGVAGYRVGPASRSTGQDVHRYRETGALSPSWSESEQDAEMETNAPVRRGRPRNTRAAFAARTEIDLVSPDSEDPETSYGERLDVQPHSRSFTPGQRYAEEDIYRQHSQRQAVLQSRDDPRFCTYLQIASLSDN